MAGLTPKLPIAIDSDDGIMLIKTYRDLAIQNLKNVLLTSPGERIMLPEFGVGIYNFLFEMNTIFTRADIEAEISMQVGRYLPSIQLLQIGFNPEPSLEEDHNVLSIFIRYAIPALGVADLLRLDFD